MVDISNDRMIAYCGLDCEKCDAHRATVNDDNELREKTAELWSRLNGVEITREMINCSGCRVDGVKTPFCNSICPIRKCAYEKGIDTCADCNVFENCEILETITAQNREAYENLKKRQK